MSAFWRNRRNDVYSLPRRLAPMKYIHFTTELVWLGVSVVSSNSTVTTFSTRILLQLGIKASFYWPNYLYKDRILLQQLKNTIQLNAIGLNREPSESNPSCNRLLLIIHFNIIFLSTTHLFLQVVWPGHFICSLFPPWMLHVSTISLCLNNVN
jgi:hypothetical protein